MTNTNEEYNIGKKIPFYKAENILKSEFEFFNRETNKMMGTNSVREFRKGKEVIGVAYYSTPRGGGKACTIRLIGNKLPSEEISEKFEWMHG